MNEMYAVSHSADSTTGFTAHKSLEEALSEALPGEHIWLLVHKGYVHTEIKKTVVNPTPVEQGVAAVTELADADVWRDALVECPSVNDKPAQAKNVKAKASAQVDWSAAPEWAKFHAFDGSGRGFWYGAKPYWVAGERSWFNVSSGANLYMSEIPKPALVTPSKSLTKRPKAARGNKK